MKIQGLLGSRGRGQTGLTSDDPARVGVKKYFRGHDAAGVGVQKKIGVKTPPGPGSKIFSGVKNIFRGQYPTGVGVKTFCRGHDPTGSTKY